MKVFLDTYGCAINQSDSQLIRGVLAGHEFVTSPAACDVVIVNSCGVKLQTESKIADAVRKYAAMGKRVILAGCLPRVNPRITASLGVETVDLDSYYLLPQMLGGAALPEAGRTELPMWEDASVTGIVPVSEGCLGRCAYCGVRHARGRLKSYPEDWVVSYAERLVRMGKKQLFLTSQDMGCYGLDTGTSLPQLLDKIAEIDGHFRVRVGMMNPQFALRMAAGLIRSFQSEKLYSFIHIPVQSGSDAVLKSMRRGYKASDYEALVERLREGIPGVAIATDIIVGFPTETDADFNETVRLVEETRPDLVNISKFYPRPMTEAAGMKLLPTKTIAKRSIVLSRLCRKISLESNERCVGTDVECLVAGKTKYGDILGRSRSFRQVAMKRGETGDFATVRITGCTPALLKA